MTETPHHKCSEKYSFETKMQIGVVASVIVMIFAVSGMAASPKADETSKNIVSHKALYKMRLDTVSSGVPLTDVKGELFFKWQESCENWQTDHKFSVDYYYADRPNAKVHSSYQAVEMKDESMMFFQSESKRNGVIEEHYKGQVLRNPETQTGEAIYKVPQDLSFELPAGFVLPTEHSRIFVEKAKAGERFYHAVLFDGTDGEGPVSVNAFIGNAVKKDALPAYDAEKIDMSLLEKQSWPVRLAFFGAGEDAQETPLYEMQMTLHENGIVSDITMEYKQFSIHQELVALEQVSAIPCEMKNQ